MTAEQTMYMEWAEKMVRKYPGKRPARRGNVGKAHADFVNGYGDGPVCKVSAKVVIDRAKDEGIFQNN